MSERDTEIDFDFFEEPEPEPAEPPRRSLRRAPRDGPPRRPPGGGIAPLIRLVVLVAVAIALVVALVFVVDRCRGNDKEGAYEEYMADVRVVADDSQQVGRDFTELLDETGLRQADVQSRLRGLATRQRQGIDRASGIDAPGALREQHEQLIEALQLRASGLDGMARAFSRTTNVRRPREAAELLAEQVRRLVASDIVWDDLFKEPARRELERRDVTGVAVPESRFLEDPNVVALAQMTSIYRRVRGATVGIPKDAVRGNGVVSVTALPQNEELSTDDPKVIRASMRLAFRVAVENSGDVAEGDVRVRLTIAKSPAPIVKDGVIELIDPGQTQTVTFRNIGAVPIGPQTTVTVEVEPVPNELSTENNTAEYPVFFSLAP